MHGQCCRGRAVDCRYFICGVFDELYGIHEPLPPRLPLSTAVHNRAEAFNSLRQLMGRYPTCSTKTNEPCEPGDVLIVRPVRSHVETLQHAIIVGPSGRFWHAGKGGVAYIAINHWAIAHSFRMLEKHRWV